MKKMICLALVVLSLLVFFTGCSGRAYTDYDGATRRNSSMTENGNVSTNRDGTVGRNRTNRGSHNGKTGSGNKNAHADMGVELEIGK